MGFNLESINFQICLGVDSLVKKKKKTAIMALPKIMSNCKLYRIPLQMQAGVESICRVRWVKFKACGKDPCMKFQYLKKRMSELELGLKTNTS